MKEKPWRKGQWVLAIEFSEWDDIKEGYTMVRAHRAKVLDYWMDEEESTQLGKEAFYYTLDLEGVQCRYWPHENIVPISRGATKDQIEAMSRILQGT